MSTALERTCSAKPSKSGRNASLHNKRRPSVWMTVVILATGGVTLCDGRATEPPPAPPERAATEVEETPLTADDYRHWAFRPLTRPALPDVKDAAWSRTPVDRFVTAKQEAAGLRPLPSVDRRRLLRRLAFDLLGLPPRADEVAEVVDDESPDAVACWVDRCLARPEYGERWAQSWLDLARFAETDGFEHDLVRPSAWRYRDWVINALNADLPFDEFARRQLAGDLLDPQDPALVLATGFLVCGPDMPDLNRQEERRHVVLNEMTSTVGSVFLGLQFGCAECHDHKYDPLSQADFYRLRAFFEPLDLFREQPLPGRSEVTSNPRGDERMRVVLPGEPRPTFVHPRGDFQQPGPRVAAAFPRIATVWSRPATASTVTQQEPPRPPSRLEFARWLTAPERGLFARVHVNRLWQAHFGRGLVASAGDFGLMGDAPTHPELLEWLATELPRREFSQKAMHRLIVLSATYAQQTWHREHAEAQPNLSADTRRDLLVGMPRRRLDGEVIRDTLLELSGRMVRQMRGPGVRPPLPPELTSTLLKNQWEVSPHASDHARRSIYLFVRRNLRFPLFEAFDRPDPNISCPVRFRSTTAPQALVLFNSDFTLAAATGIADLVERSECRSLRERIEFVFQHVLGRAPSTDETAASERFLSDGARWVDLCRTLVNLNEFLYVD